MSSILPLIIVGFVFICGFAFLGFIAVKDADLKNV
jgi:hypothetical protein